MANVTKVMKYELVYIDGGGEFHELQSALWNLQKETRSILNTTIREMYLATSSDSKFSENALYHRFCAEYPDMLSSTVNAVIQEAKKRYRSSIKSVLRGESSLPSYKSDQPILFHNQSVKLIQNEKEYRAELSFFSKNFQQDHPDVKRPCFRLKAEDGTQRTILQNLISKNYKLGQCQLSYERPKWFLSVVYSHETAERVLDENRILGADLGCVNALYASSFGNKGAFRISGEEISAFERKQAAMQNRAPQNSMEKIEALEKRKKEKQHQARYCGEGRIGHGTKTRVAPAYQDQDKIANFQKTINHRYSKALIDYAVKNKYGTIQMEDLSGIKEGTDYPKRLRHWTYFDLQTKIEYKAKEAGIKVVKVNPQYTSQRCSRCGFIDARNRPTQEKFCCIVCGFETNADYNASQNLSIAGIDRIIEETQKTKDANRKET